MKTSSRMSGGEWDKRPGREGADKSRDGRGRGGKGRGTPRVLHDEAGGIHEVLNRCTRTI